MAFLQDKMRLMLNRSKQIQLNEKAQVMNMMHDSKMRNVMTEILQEITSPKQVQNTEVLRLISDILRFILTLFVHEQDADYRLLAVILESSQQLFFISNKRKQNLTYYLLDHGIWQDTGAWRECIEATMKYKIQEAINRQKRRDQYKKAQQGQDQPQNNDKSAAKKGA